MLVSLARMTACECHIRPTLHLGPVICPNGLSPDPESKDCELNRKEEIS